MKISPAQQRLIDELTNAGGSAARKDLPSRHAISTINALVDRKIILVDRGTDSNIGGDPANYVYTIAGQETPEQKVQRLADEHMANALSDDPERFHCLSATYQASQKAFRDAFTAVYPDIDVERFESMDCMDEIAYAVDQWREAHQEELKWEAEMARFDRFPQYRCTWRGKRKPSKANRTRRALAHK